MAKGQKKQKQTIKVIEALKHSFSIGSNVRDACSYAEISEPTYYRWCEEDKELRERFEVVRSKQIFKALKVIDDAINAGDVSTAKWLLERKRKEEFSTKINQQVTGKDGGSIQYDVSVPEIKEALDELINRL